MSDVRTSKVVSADTDKSSSPNESIGYFIIPFRINSGKYRSFKNHLETLSVNGRTSAKNRFKNCRYLFLSITDIYKNADYFTVDTEKLKRNMKNGADEWGRILPLKAQESTERVAAEIEEISAFIMDKTKGYLLFKINYRNLELIQIESFSYLFRRIANSTRNQSSFARVACYILGVEDYENFNRRTEDMTTPFYYLSSTSSYVCDVLQLVCRKIQESRNEHLACLGRGYINIGATTDNFNENSDYDIIFQSNKFATWVGCPNTLTCVLEEENKFTSYTRSNIENDYLCLYLTLQNQRHSLLSFMTDMVNNRDKPRQLIKIHNALNKFKLAESFKTVSNEHAFQNIYERMYLIQDIDKLTEDINDVSANAAEQKSKRIESAFAVLAIVSAIETFYNLSEPFLGSGCENKARIVCVALSSASILFAVLRVYLSGKINNKK